MKKFPASHEPSRKATPWFNGKTRRVWAVAPLMGRQSRNIAPGRIAGMVKRRRAAGRFMSLVAADPRGKSLLAPCETSCCSSAVPQSANSWWW